MLLLVDPSCYDASHVKTAEFSLHIFALTLENYPTVVLGDIVRLHRAGVEARPRDGKPDFRIHYEKDVVVFPWDPRREPTTAASGYAVTTEDLETIRRLKAWSLERYRQSKQAAGPVEPKLITLAVSSAFLC